MNNKIISNLSKYLRFRRIKFKINKYRLKAFNLNAVDFYILDKKQNCIFIFQSLKKDFYSTHVFYILKSYPSKTILKTLNQNVFYKSCKVFISKNYKKLK